MLAQTPMWPAIQALHARLGELRAATHAAAAAAPATTMVLVRAADDWRPLAGEVNRDVARLHALLVARGKAG